MKYWPALVAIALALLASHFAVPDAWTALVGALLLIIAIAKEDWT